MTTLAHNRPRLSAPPRAAAPAFSPAQMLADYRLALLSRQISLVGRREVLSGNAKFGIFGDGKELAQLALARVVEPGDWRAGYYRDQTLLLALNMLTPRQLFAQLYGHADVAHEPSSGGRAMVNHPATRLLDASGRWLPQIDAPNSSADLSATAGQMPRLVGLAYASRLYRELDALHELTGFSRKGRELAFGTIGNASCAEGLFWEALNAIGVLRAPAVISIWDDGYGISVPNELELMGADLSALLEGFRRKPGAEPGFDIYRVPGWDYRALREAYWQAAQNARQQGIPALVHVVELTQPLGHSTSGSHERYKTPERLAWEAAHDPLPILRRELIEQGAVSEEALTVLEREICEHVEAEREAACQEANTPLRAEAAQLADLLDTLDDQHSRQAAQTLRLATGPRRRELAAQAHAALVRSRHQPSPARAALARWRQAYLAQGRLLYGASLTSEGDESPLRVAPCPPSYAHDAPLVQGFELLKANFDALLARDPRVFLFGEDVGRLGDVNQGAAGLQARYGPLRVDDTGIREATIIGQAIGMALRGLRPIAEVQYLDYIYYALMTLTDDLACLRWRTAGGQKAPVIVRTRGHRLEGIWHSGSPISVLLGALRGMHLLVPRDMTRAAGFYNTLLRGDDPALVIETLNGYRLREKLPQNLGQYCLPLGVPDLLRAGADVTIVTYGACCRIALAAAELLAAANIDAEVIDVQTLLPFDLEGQIVRSLAKTARLVVLDEDVPGGASAFILQQVLETQGGYWELDSPPRTVTAQAHRPAYSSDGDYFSKPNAEDVFDAVYDLMHEACPARYPALTPPETV
jgi:pyruvate/2-oxoglutarate/acetoin dehydrogenase E1 component/TPP-dependent pyruvate/acetoin dehydrogenase alpha subunit